jgi:hypothetical protein
MCNTTLFLWYLAMPCYVGVGALPWVIPALDPKTPIYAGSFVMQLVCRRLQEYNLYNPDRSVSADVASQCIFVLDYRVFRLQADALGSAPAIAWRVGVVNVVWGWRRLSEFGF